MEGGGEPPPPQALRRKSDRTVVVVFKKSIQGMFKVQVSIKKAHSKVQKDKQ